MLSKADYEKIADLIFLAAQVCFLIVVLVHQMCDASNRICIHPYKRALFQQRANRAIYALYSAWSAGMSSFIDF